MIISEFKIGKLKDDTYTIMITDKDKTEIDILMYDDIYTNFKNLLEDAKIIIANSNLRTLGRSYVITFSNINDASKFVQDITALLAMERIIG